VVVIDEVGFLVVEIIGFVQGNFGVGKPDVNLCNANLGLAFRLDRLKVSNLQINRVINDIRELLKGRERNLPFLLDHFVIKL
jgi:hypothetical protein